MKKIVFIIATALIMLIPSRFVIRIIDATVQIDDEKTEAQIRRANPRFRYPLSIRKPAYFFRISFCFSPNRVPLCCS